MRGGTTILFIIAMSGIIAAVENRSPQDSTIPSYPGLVPMTAEYAGEYPDTPSGNFRYLLNHSDTCRAAARCAAVLLGTLEQEAENRANSLGFSAKDTEAFIRATVKRTEEKLSVWAGLARRAEDTGRACLAFGTMVRQEAASDRRLGSEERDYILNVCGVE